MVDLFPGELPVITLEEQLAEVRREIGLREFWYPKWVEARRLTQKNADHALAAMRAVERTLQSLVENANASA